MCVVIAASTFTTTNYCGKTNNRKPFWRKTKKKMGKKRITKQNKAVIVPNLNRAKEKTHEMIYFFSCVAARR